MIPGLTSKLSEAVVASGATIEQKADIIHLTGTVNVTTIVPRNGGFSSFMIVVPRDGAVIFALGGNISVAATAPLNKATLFVYSRIMKAWLPGAIS